MAVRSRKTFKNQLFLLHISSSYAKIWGETKFQPLEFPRSGSKAINVEREREREKEERAKPEPEPKVCAI